MIRPEFLDFSIDLDVYEWLLFVPGGKRHMIFGMPIFGKENMWEKFLVFFESVDILEYLSTLRDPEASSFAKIVLNIDYYECS